MPYCIPVKFSTTNNYGTSSEDDVYTIKEFENRCETEAFIDYDGFGHPVKDKKSDNSILIKPSRLEEIPKDATHIVWFNR
jgi:hypothetical protein